MNIDELKAKIQNKDITHIWIEIGSKDEPFTYPLFIMDQSLYNEDYFDCCAGYHRYMRFYYKEYMVRFWTKTDKSE